MKIHAPKSHPRYWSNYYRDLIVWGIKKGVTSQQGLIAHGRGETFDYLIGEKTTDVAKQTIKAASAMLLLSKKPVISVNGNAVMLVPKEIVRLSDELKCPIEINIFHRSKKRELKIAEQLKKYGAINILFPDNFIIPNMASNRRMISSYGQAKADIIFIPLEDGDRTAALKKMKKKIITVDLNPLSRTAQAASITIVDNIVRCVPLLIKEVRRQKKMKNDELITILKYFDNKNNLQKSLSLISKNLQNKHYELYDHTGNMWRYSGI